MAAGHHALRRAGGPVCPAAGLEKIHHLYWKKSTTYTILKRLEGKGVLRNESGQVEALISREEYQSLQGCRFIDGSFGGSLPSFLAAFTRKRRLSAEEVRQLREMIEQFEEEP